MASVKETPEGDPKKGSEPVGPFVKYLGHKVKTRRGNAFVKMVPQDEHSTTTAFGTDFPRGFWVPVNHLSAVHRDKLAGNPGFAFSDTVPGGEPSVKPEDMVIGSPHSLGNPDADLPVYEDEAAFRAGEAN